MSDEESPAIKDEESPAIKDEESSAAIPADSIGLPVLKLCDRNPQFGTEPGDGALSFGDNREDLVRKLQSMLRDLGFDIKKPGTKDDGVDGKFGELTRAAVEDFQKSNKHVDGSPLKRDGLVGPRTADALNRQVVGKQFDTYNTPIELTKEFLLITVTSNALQDGILIETRNVGKIRLVIARVSSQDRGGASIIIGGECQDTEHVFTVREDGKIIDEETKEQIDVALAFEDSLPTRVA
jgi:peptidoglycan hydrolase-like protein with peptidoglycan-binding domain